MALQRRVRLVMDGHREKRMPRSLLHDLARHEPLTLSETIERHLATVIATPVHQDTPCMTEQTPAQRTADTTGSKKGTPAATAPQKQDHAFITTRKGVCDLTITIDRQHFSIMRIGNASGREAL